MLGAMTVTVTQASPDRLGVLASVLGRAFVTEPMMRWPLGEHGDVEQRFVQCFEYFLESLVELGVVWEAGTAMGAAVWIPPNQRDAWREAQTRETEGPCADRRRRAPVRHVLGVDRIEDPG